jgi:hypothetical protein
MSTSVPTPKALAAKPHKPLTARPVVAVTQAPPALSLPADAPFRMRYELGIRHSNLPKNARLLALVLATWADWETGHIPEGRQPGIPLMARATGMVEGSVREALYALKDRGWVRRTSNPAGGHRPSEVTLTIPPTR